MIEFVEECRREWKRLQVPDSVANEMAADLEADLREAEAEGASPEEVLGSGAFDPRSFAAAWAAARGVVAEPPISVGQEQPAAARPVSPVGRPERRWGLLLMLIVCGVVVFAGVVLAAHPGATLEARRAVSAQQAFPNPNGPGFPTTTVSLAPGLPPSVILGMVLLFVGFAALVAFALYWSPWGLPGRRSRRDGASGGPSYP